MVLPDHRWVMRIFGARWCVASARNMDISEGDAVTRRISAHLGAAAAVAPAESKATNGRGSDEFSVQKFAELDVVLWCCALMILMCDIPVFNWEKSVWQRQSDDFQTSSAGAIPCFLPRKMCKTCRTWWCLTWMEPLNCTLEMKQRKLGLLVLWSRLSLDVWHGNLTMSPVSWLLMWSQNPESDLCQDWHIPA